MKKFLTVVVASAATLFAVETRFWQHYDLADYDKADVTKLALRSDGLISLAPVFSEVYETNATYLWAITGDSRGVIYAGGGTAGATTAKLFAVEAGKGRILADLPGLEIRAIAIDKQNRIYAATSPDGKVYRLNGDKPEVFYDPKAKYIWAMAFHPSGDLFVATGDTGEIHRVTPTGQGSVFFNTEETHARSLAIDGSGNLIVGTEPGGLVLRVSANGSGFVLYQSAKREITAVAVGKDGSIYAAGVGNKTPSTLPPITVPPAPVPIATAPGANTTAVTTRSSPIPPPTFASAAATVAGGSELYRIEPDGAPKKIWSHSNDLVYSIAFDRDGLPLLGTGNKGRIFRIDSERMYTLLVTSNTTQVTALYNSSNGAVHVASANIGKIFRLGPGLEKEGTIESDALDAGAFSYWGRSRFDGDELGGTVAIETRSGNLDRPRKNWSPWAPVPLNSRNGRMTSPAARFLQYRLKLTAAASGTSPQVNLVELAYLSKNVAPTLDLIEPTPANYKFSTSSLSVTTSSSLSLPPLGQRQRSSSVSLDSASTSMSHSKGWVGARWKASDENNDSLCFKVEIRGSGETAWKLLKDNIRERQHSWDSTAFPDGEYRVRVTANDEPSNPPAEALSNSLESEIFLIDNTPPQISGLAAVMEQGKLVVRWKGRDARSVIERSEYSINGGEWHVAPPVSKLADSLELDYLLRLERPSTGELTIAVRVTDEFENQSVEKVTVR